MPPFPVRPSDTLTRFWLDKSRFTPYSRSAESSLRLLKDKYPHDRLVSQMISGKSARDALRSSQRLVHLRKKSSHHYRACTAPSDCEIDLYPTSPSFVRPLHLFYWTLTYLGYRCHRMPSQIPTETIP